jgi:hypothetical protein
MGLFHSVRDYRKGKQEAFKRKGLSRNQETAELLREF